MTRSSRVALVVVGLAGACNRTPPPTTQTASPVLSSSSSASAPVPAPPPVMTAFALPGATGPVTTDYIVCDRARGKVWVPVGDTASVDVFDVATSSFTRVDGFKNAERVVRDKKRFMGPSAVTIGDGVAYIGDRASSDVCAVDVTTLKLGACLTLPTPTDGVVYVASAKEVWVTTPKDQSLTVLDAATPDKLKPKLVIKTEGAVEGYAVDDAHGLFYTNLEDKNRTVAVDIKTHAVKSSWPSGCGPDGPRGAAVDSARGLVFVACTDGVRVLRDGAVASSLDTGAGVDNIEYVESSSTLYVAAPKASRLSAVRVGDKGDLSVVATGATAEGARNATVDGKGSVYLVDPMAARLLVFPAGSLR